MLCVHSKGNDGSREHFQIILNEIMKAKRVVGIGYGDTRYAKLRCGRGRGTVRYGLPSALCTTNRLSQIFLMRVIIIMKQVLHTETTPVPGLTRLSLSHSSLSPRCPLALPLSLLTASLCSPSVCCCSTLLTKALWSGGRTGSGNIMHDSCLIPARATLPKVRSLLGLGAPLLLPLPLLLLLLPLPLLLLLLLCFCCKWR